MSSTFYFDFLGSVWDYLPEEDRERFGELWQGYEQVFASVYQKFAENNINVVIEDLLPFSTERWLPYKFNSDNFVSRPAVFTSTQDLSLGVNLLQKYMVRFRIDGGLEFSVDLRGANPQRTVISEIIQKINDKAGFEFAKPIFDNTILQLTSPTSGASSSIEILPTNSSANNASEFVLGVLPSDLPKKVPEFPYTYTLPYQRVASIPLFRDQVRDENVSVSLSEGTDYAIEDKTVVAFKEEPPEDLWAKRTLVDEENPWNNFGFLMDIYQPNSPRYVNVLQGLWYAFWTGPRPKNVRIALYLLFGLPTARENATVTEASQTKIKLTGTSGEDYEYEVPDGLDPAVSAGESVPKFTPLVTGIEVFDKINSPGFIENEIGRAGIQRFLLDEASRGSGADTDETKALRMLEEYTFLPQISVESFITPDIDLSNVKTFLDAIKPLNKTYLFQVIVGAFKDELPFKDFAANHPNTDLSPTLDSNETTYLESATLDSYETTEIQGLNLDPNGILFEETLAIEVYSSGSLIDSFDA